MGRNTDLVGTSSDGLTPLVVNGHGPCALTSENPTSKAVRAAEFCVPSVFIHICVFIPCTRRTRCRRAERCREQLWSLLSIFTAAAAELVIIRACHGTHAVPERAAAAAVLVHRAMIYTRPAHQSACVCTMLRHSKKNGLQYVRTREWSCGVSRAIRRVSWAVRMVQFTFH